MNTSRASPPYFMALREKRADYKLRFFIRQLYGTAGLAAALSRAMSQDDDK
jgi:hypothetical protein